MQKSFGLRGAEGAAVLLAWLAFVALAIAAHGKTVLPGDRRLAIWIQSWRVAGLDHLTNATNHIMSGWFLTGGTLVLCTCLLVRRATPEALFLGNTIFMRFGNGIIKELIRSPRPTPDLVHVAHSGHGFGFPSGHTVGAVAFGIAVAWIGVRHFRRVEARALIWLGAILLIVITGIGRVRVGAHWPSDVLGAVLWAGPLMLVLGRIILPPGRAERSPVRQ
jgi:membrane-associated phospholipid phosphatase